MLPPSTESLLPDSPQDIPRKLPLGGPGGLELTTILSKSFQKDIRVSIPCHTTTRHDTIPHDTTHHDTTPHHTTHFQRPWHSSTLVKMSNRTNSPICCAVTRHELWCCSARDVEENVLVYCSTGMASVALVVGYLMAKVGP